MSKSNKQTKQTNKKNDVKMITIKNDKNENVEIAITTLRDTLLNELRIATKKRDIRECKRIRNRLRKTCKHYGALRQRTYIDKSNDNMRIVVNEKIDAKK